MKKIIILIPILLLASCTQPTTTTTTNTTTTTTTSTSTAATLSGNNNTPAVSAQSGSTALGANITTKADKVLYTNTDLGFVVELPANWKNFSEKKQEFPDKSGMSYDIELPTNDPDYSDAPFNGKHKYISFYALTKEELQRQKELCKKNDVPCPGVQDENIIATLSDGRLLMAEDMTIMSRPNDANPYLNALNITTADLEQGLPYGFKTKEYLRTHTNTTR